MKRPATIFLAVSGLILAVQLRDLLSPSIDRLPGVDSVNLYTWELFTRASLSAGQLPFWNPYHFAGTPHLADPQTTVLYPPAMLLRWLPAPAFFGWMIVLHLWIAGAGAFYAARVVGLGWLAATAAGFGVMLGGSVAGWIHDGHLLVLYSAVWVPWALALAVVSVRSGRLIPDGRLTVVLVLQILTGYLQGSLYLAAALGLYFGFSALWPPVIEGPAGVRVPRWKPLGQLALLAVLGAAGAAFQLLPTATLVSEAGRSVGLVYGEALAGSWQISDLATLFFPFHQVPELPVHRFLADRLVYVGWVLAAFVPFAFLVRERRRLAVFFLLLALLAIGFALGDTLGLYRIHHALFPGLRVPGRVLFLATVGLALLGAMGLEAFLTLAAGRQWRRLVAGAAGTITAVVLAATIALGDAGALSEPAPGWPWAPLISVAAVLAVAASACRGWRQAALMTAVTAVLFDVTVLNADSIATLGIEPPAVVQRAIGPPTQGRALTLCEHRVSAREFLQNGEAALDGPASLSLRGYGEWAFMVKTGEMPGNDGYYRRIGSEGKLPARRDLLDMANVARIIACPPGLPEGSARIEVQPNPRAWPRALWACAAEEVSRRELITRLLQGRYDSDGQLRPRHYLKVRWTSGLPDDQRFAIASRLQLEDGVWLEGTTWRYALGDASPDAVLAIIREPEVDDTHGVDRGTGALMRTAVLDPVEEVPGDDGERQLLVGGPDCPTPVPVEVTAMDRADGYFSARVNAPTDGFMFLSEPYYSDRHVYVDGRRAAAVRANLAFTAVAVPAGDHRVELRYARAPFYLGSAISLMTAAGYTGLAFIRRRRRSR